MRTILRRTIPVFAAILFFADPVFSQPAAPLEEVLAQLRSYAEVQLRQSGVPGMSYAVVKDGQVVDSRSFGVKDIETGEPVDTDTVFEIGSCTKAFTAALTAIAADEGKLKWSERVHEILPDWAMYNDYATRDTRVFDLMSQSNGMANYSLVFMGYLGYPADYIANASRYVRPVTPFRSSFAFQIGMFETTRLALEKRMNGRYADLLQRRIFDPLQMTRTFTWETDSSAIPNIARGHVVRKDGTLLRVPDDWALNAFLESSPAAEGIRSTVLDLAKWARLQLGKGDFEGQRIVSEEGILNAWTPKIEVGLQPDLGNTAYANGWLYQTKRPVPVIWYGGGTLSMRGIVALIPDAGMAITVLTNTGVNRVPENMFKKLYSLYYAAGYPSDEEDEVASDLGLPFDAARASAVVPAESCGQDCFAGRSNATRRRLTGTYRNRGYGKVRVALETQELVVYIGPRKVRAALVPNQQDNSYTVYIPQWPNPLGEARFVARKSGEIHRLELEVCEDINRGRFERVR